MAKIGRNERCHCGSGKKYKHCHGAFSQSNASGPNFRPTVTPVFELGKKGSEASERLRIRQQGLGKRIESFEHRGQRFVVAGDKLYASAKWKTFIDFLGYYLHLKLGKEWLAAELSKAEHDRHVLLAWNDALRNQTNARGGERGTVQHLALTGAASCYLGLAYNLYLLEHNVELQARYLQRLRDRSNFQGAYYELIVANVLIRAGFRLELEDEANQESKHCEFSAVSTKSNRKYWIEAKMRGVNGQLGRTAVDGVSPTKRDVTNRLTHHLGEALAKPAPGERLIFIDLNAECETNEAGEPSWMKKAVRRLDARERDLAEGQSAYVFVTNLAFHRALNKDLVERQVFAYGLGIADFSKPGYKTLIQIYREKQKHLDAHEIMEALKGYPHLPSTFDGSLPSDAFGKPGRNIRIGESYFFDSIGEKGAVAEVTSAVVLEPEKLAYLIVSTQTQQGLILTYPLSDDQLADYRKFPDIFFGEVDRNGGNTEDPFEFFEWMLGIHKDLPKAKLLGLLSKSPDFQRLSTLTQEELALAYCERQTLAVVHMNSPGSLRSSPA